MTTDPVKLISVKNSKDQNHSYTNFAKATINALEELLDFLVHVSWLTFHSQDDKAKAPIEITAASKQAPLLMHKEYKVILPDHDYVVAPQHKLIPSATSLGMPLLILAQRTVQFEALNTLAPVLMALWLSSSTRYEMHTIAWCLWWEFQKQRWSETSHDCCGRRSSGWKNQIYKNNWMRNWLLLIDYFNWLHLSQDLDAFFLATNAPGRSAFNRVERRMVKFSKELSGAVLPHDNFGYHQNAKGETINKELEKNSGMPGRYWLKSGPVW